MITLGIDTAGPASGVALVEDGRVAASFYLRRSSTFSRPLLRSVDLVCQWAGCALADLTGLAVNVGPGAFTGIRVGLATAQGLAMASGKPLIGCNAFEALVALVPHWEGMVCPMFEARRGEVYAAFYRQCGHDRREVVPGMVVTPETLCTLVTECTLFLGSGVPVYGTVLTAALGAWAVCMDTGMEDVGVAVSVARLAQARLRAPEAAALSTPQPLYIRAADARLPRHMAGAARRKSTPEA